MTAQTVASSKFCDEKGREYYFDNAKFILIFFVVLAHLMSPLKSYFPAVNVMWIMINTLHMPCLIFISGYFAKSYIKKDGSFNMQRPFTYLVYYVFAQITVSLFEYFVLGHTDMEKSFFAARSSLWFLQCLIIWFVILPFVAKIKKKYVIVLGFLFGIMIGYDTAVGGFLSVSRVIVHFPFFILGYYFKKEWFFKFRTKITRIVAVVTLVFMTYLVWIFRDEIPKRIITCDHNYYSAQLDVRMRYAWIARILFYVAAIVLCTCFLLLVPRVKLFFTRWGSRTLQVYIWHRFIYLAELEYAWITPFMSTTGCVVMVFIALATTIVLSLKVFEIPFMLLNRIKLKSILRDVGTKQSDDK